MEPHDLLSSWKEISAYLGVDERTCQRWEKRFGLPVRRHDSSPKSRVFASRADLDRWKEQTARDSGFVREERSGSPAANGGAADRVSGPEIPRRMPRGLLPAAGIVLALAAAALWLGPEIFLDRRPADFRIEAPELVILNKGGRELGRYTIGLEDLVGEEHYRKRFQGKMIGDERGPNLPGLMIRDLDRDGRREILFSPRATDEVNSGRLVLLDRKASEIWAFETGREIVSGKRRFGADFVIDGFDVFDPDHDGIFDILVISHALGEYPTRVLILDLRKEILGEYWNAGQFTDYLIEDLDGDERPEVLLAGQNNEYVRPALVVFDSAAVRGASPQGEEYRFDGVGPGGEKLYILFPLTPVDDLSVPGITLTGVRRLLAERIQVLSGNSSINFEFDFRLSPLTVSDSHTLQRKYAEAVRVGKIKEPYSRDRILRKLLDGILYYDGEKKAWVPHWALSNPW